MCYRHCKKTFLHSLMNLILIVFLIISADYRTCAADDHKCGNGLCVPKEKKCDGYFDCRDKSDEDGCPGTSCDLSEFRCANGEKCIAEFQKCNHRKECSDGSDEENCSKLHSHSARNFFKTFHGANKAKTGTPIYGLLLGSFESQSDGPHKKWSKKFPF